MLLNSHDLNSIITKFFDAWQHIISKFGICVDFWFLDFTVDNIGRIRKENQIKEKKLRHKGKKEEDV
jgi:hypothetical protein